MPIQVEGYGISPQQKRLWQLTHENPTFMSELLIHLKGDVEKERLKAAVSAVIARHEALRTRFHQEPGLKDPIQVILQKGILDWSECFLEARGAESLEHALAATRKMHGEGGLDREGTVVVRVVLFSLGEREKVLSLRVPALVADTATLQNIFREIGEEYDGGSMKSAEAPTQYLEFSEWQNDLLAASEAEAGHSYWRTKTSSETATLLFPFENQDSKSSFTAGKVSRIIHPAIVEQVHGLARKLNVEEGTVWLAAWQSLLWRMARQNEITVSVSFSGREYDELKGACGAFSKWLPVGSRIDSATSFLSVLATADMAAKEVAEWQQYFVPGENIVQSQISFGFAGKVEPITAGGIELGVYGIEVRSEGYKLKLEVSEGEGGWKSELHYDGGRFCRRDVECLAEQYASLLESAVKNPEASVSELEINSTEQKKKLQEWHGAVNGIGDEKETLTGWFEQQVERSSGSVAVACGEEKLSYRELNERANQLAHYLRGQGVKAEEKVGLLLERGIEMLVAIVGVLKAGGAYVPMDPEYPQERMRMMMEDTRARLVITQKKFEEKLVAFEGLETGIVVLEQEKERIGKESKTNPGRTAEIGNAAYVIYTSGSTGKPKGVVITQRNVVRLFQMTEGWLKFSSKDVWSLFHNYAFDVSVWEMWGTWLYGGKLVVISREETRSPEQFYEVLKREQVTILSQTPSAFRQLQPVMVEREKEDERGKELAVRAVVFAGEALNPALVADWAQKYPEAEMLNLYGITETTVHSTYKKLSKEDIGQTERSPIGVGFGDLRLYVMTEKMVEAGIWEQGEIYVAGAGLARGYLNRPELTAERFLPEIGSEGRGERMYRSGDLARRRGDGELEYVGRGDDQVKIRGYRVELGEIEAAVRKQGGVKETAVLVKGEGAQRRLVCYVFPEAGQEVEVEKLREQLLVRLPEYMVPAVFVVLEKMPLTGNGKLDKRALPEPGNLRPKLKQQFVPPASELEVVIANLWAEALKLEKVGVQDNFFDIGGHSMLMIQVHGKLRKVLAREISVVDLFARPTISLLAEFLSQRQDESSFKIDDEVEQRRAMIQNQRRARAARRAAVGAEV